ncbi:MAG: ABC transporter substrate-binding protein [Thiolinea sp.]
MTRPPEPPIPSCFIRSKCRGHCCRRKQPDTLGVKALDEHTLEIRLVDSTPYFLQLLTHPVASPVHQQTVEQYGDQWTTPEHMVSNGLFKLTEWVPQGHITLVKSDSYWDKEAVKLDKVIFYPTSDLAAELKAFAAGELDYTYSVPRNRSITSVKTCASSCTFCRI